MRMEATHFVCYFPENERELAERFSALLERECARICGDFGFCEDKVGKIELYLCGEVDEFLERTGKSRESYQPWMIGYSNAAARQISLLLPSVAGVSEGELCKVLTHELVHIIFDGATDVGEEESECWLAEGIAILYAEQTELAYVSENDYPQISELSGCGDVGAERFADHGGYDYGGIYVWYFLQRFGFECFLEAYRGERSPAEWLYDGFEREAIIAYRAQVGEGAR